MKAKIAITVVLGPDIQAGASYIEVDKDALLHALGLLPQHNTGILARLTAQALLRRTGVTSLKPAESAMVESGGCGHIPRPGTCGGCRLTAEAEDELANPTGYGDRFGAL